MAKDKGQKATKSTSNDDFGKPSDAPAGGDGWKFSVEDNLGKLFLITPLRTETTKGFEEGTETEVIVADIVELNEKKPEKSEEHENVFIFPKWIQGSLRGYIGEKRVLGRLDQDASKGRGKNAAWVLEDADDDDVAIARAYLASVDPFAQKGGKEKKADEPKAKAKKAKK